MDFTFAALADELYPSPDPFGPDVNWEIYRDYSTGYEGDDYIPLDGWHGEKHLNGWMVQRPPQSYDFSTSPMPSRPRSWSTRMVVKVRVSGKRDKGGKLRPRNWSVTFGMGGFHSLFGDNVEKPQNFRSARTLAQIKRMVDEIDFSKEIDAAQRAYYSQARSTCIYARVGSEWVPFCTAFDTEGVDHIFTTGEYEGIQLRTWKPHRKEPFDEFERRSWSVHSWGYSGGIRTEHPPVAHWFTDEFVQAARNRLGL